MDQVTAVKKATREGEWEERIRACRSSGLLVNAWCNQNGINAKTYYYHLRKLRERACEQIPVPVCVRQNSGAAVVIHGISGITAEIADGTSIEIIEAVVRAIKC